MDVPGRKPQDGNDEPSLLCDPCKGENEDMPAVSYCTVCNDYLCHGCRKAHTRAKDSRDHNLMEQDSMPKQKPTNSDESECPKHSNKALEYYCKTDDRFCCSVCATIDHKQCSIKYIDDVALDFNRSNEYAGLEKTITDLIRLLQKTKDISTRNNKNIETTHANFISDLKQFRTEINNKLDSLEKAALREAKIARDSEKKTVDSIATTCDSMLSDISKLSTKSKALNTYKQERQLVICSKMAAKTVNTYGYRVDELSQQNKVKDYHFQPNEKIRHFLYSLDSIGHMNDGNDDGEIRGHAMGPVVYSSTSGQPVASHVRNIDTRHTTDRKGYWMTCGVMIDHKRLALVDREKSCVKVADVDTNIILSCIKLPTQLFDIKCVNQDQSVVTCSDYINGKLIFIKVGRPLSVLREINIGRNCRGIVYTSTSDTFIVSFGYPEYSVKAINMNGKVKKIFKTNNAGDAIFSDPGYLSLSIDQLTVFVSDWSNHSVTSLTLDGTVQQVYTEGSLKYPRGLAVDRNYNVYIAGYWSDDILQLSVDGRQNQVLLGMTCGVEDPCMVTYCKTRHRLYVSGRREGCFGVSVYQLHT